MNSGIAASATLGTLLVTLASMVFVPLDPELGLRIALVIVVAASLGYAARERARVPSAVVIAIDTARGIIDGYRIRSDLCNNS